MNDIVGTLTFESVLQVLRIQVEETGPLVILLLSGRQLLKRLAVVGYTYLQLAIELAQHPVGTQVGLVGSAGQE